MSGTLAAVEKISQMYADGTPILFRGALERLQFGKQCLSMLEESLEGFEAPAGLNPQAETEALAGQLVKVWVHQARFDLHQVRGESVEAEPLFAQRIVALTR